MNHANRVIDFLVAVFLISGCASQSVLISPNDRQFQRAQERLQSTRKEIEKIDAPDSEKNSFLQAEGFDQYRFEPPAPSKMAYLTEIAAAVTDFPALQSLSGSLSLVDLRMRSSDSAVQLWETLLKNHPDTKLRSLTLYRLGWAYRNTSVEGLPHHSPDEPFDELIKEQPNSELAVLAQKAKEVPWKSKSVATEKSLLPGLGQIYVGETKSGVIRLSIAAVAAAAIIYPLAIAAQRGRESTWDKDWPLLAMGLGGLITLSIDYTNSYEDAMRGVVQWNERQENEFYRENSQSP